jgi:hypothetical protein
MLAEVSIAHNGHFSFSPLALLIIAGQIAASIPERSLDVQPGCGTRRAANSGVFVFGHLLPMNEQDSFVPQCFVRP